MVGFSPVPNRTTQMILYWTGPTKNTERFVNKLTDNATLLTKDTILTSNCILVVPTYGTNGEIPGPVRTFLNYRPNRQYIEGVIGTGNRNFGADFAAAGRTIASKLHIPLIATVEIAGTEKDVKEIKKWLEQLNQVQTT